MAIGILAPELKSIEQLFAGEIRFSVPTYQRSFAWTSDETEELWEDVDGAVTRGGQYFLGTIVVQNTDSGPQEIIDGQQRLACITMLFSAIRNVFKSHSDDRELRIEMTFLGAKDFGKQAQLKAKLSLNKTNNETFRQYVLGSVDSADIDAALNKKKREIHPSNRLLLEAYRFFLGKVADKASKLGTRSDEFIEPLIETLKSNLKLITIPVSSTEDANLFFESLNARGKELAISDLVKNRVYFEAKDEVSRAEQLWEQMEKDLGRRPVPEYIRHFWIAKQLEKGGPNVREKNLYRLVNSEIKGDAKKAITLATDLKDNASVYSRITDYSLWPDDSAYGEGFEASLRDLRLFRVSQMNRLNAIDSFSSSPKDVAKTFRYVANFAFRYFIIGNQSPGNLERVSASIAYEIREKNYTSPQDVADALRGVNSDPTFRSDFELDTIESPKIARYTLTKINNYLARQASQTGVEQIANPDAKAVNLEHVLPQDVPLTWRASFSSGIDPSDFVYRIGNLTLLAAGINRDLADKSFAEKKKAALDGSTLKINDYFKTVSAWADKEIEQRQKALAKAAVEVWKL
jgi:uncharacterized protein with ParB-like and HNH nuclease domain